jgi:hypothetical protein
MHPGNERSLTLYYLDNRDRQNYNWGVADVVTFPHVCDNHNLDKYYTYTIPVGQNIDAFRDANLDKLFRRPTEVPIPNPVQFEGANCLDPGTPHFIIRDGHSDLHV